jgi:hypothetical protein
MTMMVQVGYILVLQAGECLIRVAFQVVLEKSEKERWEMLMFRLFGSK